MSDSLTYLFGGALKTRLLQALVMHPETAYHLRGLATAAGVDSGNAVKALRGLIDAHFVKVVPDIRGLRYQIDERSPLIEPLRQMFLLSSELMTDLKSTADTLPADHVLVFGSLARGSDKPESDIDILVVGDISTIEAQSAFKPVSRKHRREINVMAVDAATLERQLSEGSEFWRDVMDNKTILLKGKKLNDSFSQAAIA